MPLSGPQLTNVPQMQPYQQQGIFQPMARPTMMAPYTPGPPGMPSHYMGPQPPPMGIQQPNMVSIVNVLFQMMHTDLC